MSAIEQNVSTFILGLLNTYKRFYVEQIKFSDSAAGTIQPIGMSYNDL